MRSSPELFGEFGFVLDGLAVKPFAILIHEHNTSSILKTIHDAQIPRTILQDERYTLQRIL